MDSELSTLDIPLGGKMDKFKVRALNQPQRFSFVWWPVMEMVEYTGQMSVDLLLEEYKKYVADKSRKMFFSPIFLHRYQAFVPNVGYIVFKTAEEVAEAVKIFDDLKMPAPKFQEKASTFVVEWPISKNTMKTQYSALLEDGSAAALYMSLTKKNYDQVQQFFKMGKSLTEYDIVATCAEGPLNYQKWTPVDIGQNTFFTLLQVIEKDQDPDKTKSARKILEDILQSVANKAKPAKGVLLEQLGHSISPAQLRSKLLSGSGTSPALAQAIEETANNIDVDAMLASMDTD